MFAFFAHFMNIFSSADTLQYQSLPFCLKVFEHSLIFMKTLEIKKMVEKIGGGGVHTTLAKCKLLTIKDYQTC